VSVLTPGAAMYHFLSGFTSKLAGTEVGLGEKPEETFSTCFGAPFLPLAPITYVNMLRDRIARHSTKVFLVNTGWTGGPFGVGHRIDIEVTRAIVQAATSGALDDAPTSRHEIFNLDVPVSCPGVPDEVLDPQSTWASADAYVSAARDLAQRFHKNFDRFVASVPEELRKAGPVL
jgi:phosphoenolpyruvate carboxykinase (ATP)